MNSRTTTLTIIIFALPCIWFLCFLVPSWSAMWSAEIRNIDRELLALNVVQAADFNLFSGAYSRFGFRHPGPLYFYYLAGMDWLLGWMPSWDGRLRLATLLFNLGFLILSLHLARKILALGNEVLWVFVCIALVIHVPFLFLFANYWNPWVIPLPFMTALLCAVAVMRGDWSHLPLLVVSLTLCGQSHISALAMSVALGLLAIIGGWRNRERTPGWRNYLRAGSALACLLWTPVIIDVLRFPDYGNAGRIVRFFLSEERSGFSLRKLEFALSFLIVPLREFLEPGARIPIAVLLLAIPLLGWKLLSEQVRAFLVVTLLCYAIAIFSAQRIEGPLVAYLLSPAYALAASIWCVNCIVFHRIVERSVPYGKMLAPTGAVVACLVALMVRIPREHPVRSFGDIATIQAFVDHTPFAPGTLVHLKFPARKLTPFAASFILESMRRQHAVCIDAAWAYLFGDGIECSSMQKHFGPYSRIVEMRVAAPGDSFLQGPADRTLTQGKFAAIWRQQ